MGQIIPWRSRPEVPHKVARTRSIPVPLDPTPLESPSPEQPKTRIDLAHFMGSLSIHIAKGKGSGAVYLTEPEVEQTQTALTMQGWGLAGFLTDNLPAATLKGLRDRLGIPTFEKKEGA